MSEQPEVGERRRRREAERAAQEASGASDRPLTRRELRARETALATGALELDDSTGEIRLGQEAASASRPAADDPSPVTGSLGMTRRELRQLRERAAQSAASGPDPVPAEAPLPDAPPPVVPTPPRGVAASAPSPPSAVDRSPTVAPAPAHTPTPARPPAPAPDLPRRPVVRPPATAPVRALTEDGSGLGPAVPATATRPDPASPAGWGGDGATLDVAPADVPWHTSELPATTAAVVADPGPLPTTRRSRRVADETLRDAAPTGQAGPGTGAADAVNPSLDEVIAGETAEPEPFGGRPSWPELPPTTPSGAIPAVPLRPAASSDPDVTAVDVAPPAAPRLPATTAGPSSIGRELPVDPEVPVEHEDTDDDEGDDDDHSMPRWLTALLVLVLVVIGVVLGLLVWRLWLSGDGGPAAGALLTTTWKDVADVTLAGPR